MLMDVDLWTGALRADIWQSLRSVSGKACRLYTRGEWQAFQLAMFNHLMTKLFGESPPTATFRA